MNTKRILLILVACIAISAISCKKDPKSDRVQVIEETPTDSILVVEKTEEEKKPVPKKKKAKKKKSTPKKKAAKIAVPPGAPVFQNTEARKYVRDYEAYVANYRKAVKAKDMDSFLKLSEASSNLTKQYRALLDKLSADEIDKMSKYMQKKTKQIDELSSQM